MSQSIVQRLAQWLSSRGPSLASAGVESTNRISEPSSNVPWKGTIGLVKDDILVSYTVWERTIFQTELIIVDGVSGETLLSKDATPENVEEIDGVLDSVVDGLVAGTYRRV
jgi:hypothetical protein